MINAHSEHTDSSELEYDIVAIDDDAFDLEILVRTLRKTSVKVACFVKPDEAREFLSSHQTRHLVVDYRMTGTCGLELIGELSKDPQMDGIDMYLASGTPLSESAAQELQALGAKFILKEQLYSPGYVEKLCAEDKLPLR